LLDLDDLLAAVSDSPFWEMYLHSLVISRAVRLHLAVLVEPYLTYILEGSKTVESRFAKTRGAPYNRVASGDVLLLKRQSGPIEAICCVEDAWFYQLHPASWKEIDATFGAAMRVSPQFLQSRASASYATLIRLTEVTPIQPLKARKRDRRGWVVLLDESNTVAGPDRRHLQYVLGM
jgi:hypothetical protein